MTMVNDDEKDVTILCYFTISITYLQWNYINVCSYFAQV